MDFAALSTKSTQRLGRRTFEAVVDAGAQRFRDEAIVFSIHGGNYPEVTVVRKQKEALTSLARNCDEILVVRSVTLFHSLLEQGFVDADRGIDRRYCWAVEFRAASSSR